MTLPAARGWWCLRRLGPALLRCMFSATFSVHRWTYVTHRRVEYCIYHEYYPSRPERPRTETDLSPEPVLCRGLPPPCPIRARQSPLSPIVIYI